MREWVFSRKSTRNLMFWFCMILIHPLNLKPLELLKQMAKLLLALNTKSTLSTSVLLALPVL